jgi:phospholipid transport system substrate-binding protein
MKGVAKLIVVLLFTAGLLFVNVGRTWAGEPTDAIRSAIDRGVEILKTANVTDTKERAQVIDRLRPIVYPLFDFREMAMRSLGSQWRSIGADQQTEFVTVFTKLLERSYADKIVLYGGQQVLYLGENIDGDFATVNTWLIAKDKQKYSVVYRLHKVDGKWRIYDVIVEDISLVNNYREQFRRAIAKGSFGQLLATMKEKAI